MTDANHFAINRLTRRDFLKLCGASSIGLALAACGVTPTPTPAPTNLSVPTNTPLPTSTQLPTTPPTLTNTLASTSTVTPTVTSAPTVTTIPQTLRGFATASGINFLVSLPEWYFNDQNFKKIREFGLIPDNFTGLNAQGIYLLWDKPPSQRTDSDFDLHDKTLKFARDNNMLTIMGQHLVWGNAPNIIANSWLTRLSNSQLLEVLRTHIQQVVARFTSITMWSVVNEHPRDMNFWGQRFSEDTSWMEVAFKSANESNPKAKLLLNHFGIEIPGTISFDKARRDTTLEIAKSLKAKNVPISGIGFQMHVFAKDFADENRVPKLMGDLKANIQEFQQAVGEVVVTELDARMDGVSALPLQTQLEIQSRTYQSIIASCLDAGVKTICVFGVSDRHSWLAQNTPLLFDSAVNPKPAYFAVLKVLQEYYAKQKPK